MRIKQDVENVIKVLLQNLISTHNKSLSAEQGRCSSVMCVHFVVCGVCVTVCSLELCVKDSGQ